MTWRTVGIVVMLLTLHAEAVSQDANLLYRVAGVIVTPEKRLVTLETSDGEQRLYAEGDQLEQYQVERVEPEGIWLNDDGRRLFLQLQGVPTSLQDLAAASRFRELTVVDGVGTYQMDYNHARTAFARLDEPPTEVEQRNPEFKYARMVSALQLPIKTRIVAVDGKPADSFGKARLLIHGKLQMEQTIRMTVENVPGVETIYSAPTN